MKASNLVKLIVVGVVCLALVGVALAKAGRPSSVPAASPPAPGPAPAVATDNAPAFSPAPAPAACPATAQSGEVCPVKPGAEVKSAAPAGLSTPPAPAKPADKPAAEKPKSLPRMLDLGSVSCIPCKMMVPVMDALKAEYAGKLTVEFINVNENPAGAEKYRIQAIPTQILFDKTGQEVFRHLGFWPKEEIVAKCKELGLLS